ncbi:MAG: hypothetical protein ACFFCS_02365, partial [Candidatus Hodarchaeota archaeon]
MTPRRFFKNIKEWDFLIALRLHALLFLLVFPVVHLIIQVERFSAPCMIILGIAAWLIAKYVFFEPRKDSRLFVKLSFCVLVFLFSIINLNIILGIVINFNHANPNGVARNVSFLLGSLVLTIPSIKLETFKKLNVNLTRAKEGWTSGRRGTFKRMSFGMILTLWLCMTPLFLVGSYPIRSFQLDVKHLDNKRIGIWTYGAPLDEDYNGTSMFIDNQTLQALGDKEIYLVYRIKTSHLGPELVEKLIRCRDHGVEVHVAVTPMSSQENFVNIWSFEELAPEVDVILQFLNMSGLIGNPITKLVYDMEGDPDAHFPLYGNDPAFRSKLSEYYRVKALFNDFNEHIRQDFGIPIRICTDIFQGLDFKDGDDDIQALWGLMPDDHESTTMSYMVYRRGNLGRNFILDHLRFLEDGDTILLNAWKDDEQFCWGDL